MSIRRFGLALCACVLISSVLGIAPADPQTVKADLCSRPAAGSVVPEPEDLRSENGVLRVDLTYLDFRTTSGELRYCYLSEDGSESPTLRLKPGDLLILRLKNALTIAPLARAPGDPLLSKSRAAPFLAGARSDSMPMRLGDACASEEMTPLSTNLHFHGLTIPSKCHEDDVLRTAISAGSPPYEYRFRIPPDEPPGLYWYHPHIHGFTKVQVLGGASGALIVEGIERANRNLSGLPERVFIVRDQDLLSPDATPAKTDLNSLPPVVLDAEGDAMNTGTGTGKPAKDLSLNFVPVPYPDYPPSKIMMKPSENQLWRVLNASAVTYLNLQVLYNRLAQPLGVVGLDGVPTNENGLAENRVLWQNHLGVPPGGRVEFIVKGPPTGAQGLLVTRSVNTGPAGENDPERPLATIIASEQAPEAHSRLVANPVPLPPRTSVWLGEVKPVRTRKLYFSERPSNPYDPNSPTIFMLTVEGQPEKPFDMSSTVPNITVRQGDVEDWIIENRTQEVHAFHIHQIHFMLLDWFGLPVDEPFLRDTINVPFWDGKSTTYPMIKVRMDFRDPDAVGTFVYHCHLLEHEDGGMMGTIRVLPRDVSYEPKADQRQKRPLCGRPEAVPVSLPSSHN
jgi:FtsP/CotA-like multicopper oxidase with cupredoxin domain